MALGLSYDSENYEWTYDGETQFQVYGPTFFANVDKNEFYVSSVKEWQDINEIPSLAEFPSFPVGYTEQQSYRQNQGGTEYFLRKYCWISRIFLKSPLNLPTGSYRFGLKLSCGLQDINVADAFIGLRAFMFEWHGTNGDNDFYMRDGEVDPLLGSTPTSIEILHREDGKGFFEPLPEDQWNDSNKGWTATKKLANYTGVGVPKIVELNNNAGVEIQIEFTMKKTLKANTTYVVYFLPFSGGYQFGLPTPPAEFPDKVGFPYPHQERVKIKRYFNNGVTTKSEEEECLKSTSDTYGYLNKTYPSYAIGTKTPSTITSSTQVKGNGLIFGPIPTTTITLYYKPFVEINGNKYFPMVCTNGSDDTDNKTEWKFASCFINNGNATVPQWKRGY